MNQIEEKMESLLASINSKLSYDQELFDATEEELLALQEVSGHRLPADYMEFMSKYAGAYVEANFPLINGEVGHISCFFPLDSNGVTHLSGMGALPNYYKTVQEFIPPDYFPIGGGDNVSIFLSLKDEERGAIYFDFWGSNESESSDNITLAATSFSDFINSLENLY